MSYAKIPDDVIEAVRRHHDIVDTVSKYVHLSKNGKYMKGLCPFHSEKTPSFTVTPELQIFHCYGCGKTGNVIRFVEEIESYTFPEAVRVLAEEAGIPVTWANPDGAKPTAADTERNAVLEAHELTAKLYNYLLNNTQHGRAAKDYLRDRGLGDKLINHFMIGYAPEQWDTLSRFLSARNFDPSLMEKGGLLSAKSDGSGYVDRFRGRIMFPIWDRDGKVTAFAGRIIGEGQPKYLNSPETMLFTKSRTIYNLHHARPAIRKSKQVVLFEGYMDVIKSWSAGVKNGIATMGTALTEEHCTILARQADEIVVCYDGDDAGQAAAMKSIPMLEGAGLRVMVAMLPKGKDPDEYITEYGPDSYLREIIDQPATTTKFKLIYSRKNHILLKEEGRKNYLLEAAGIVAELDSAIEREVYLQELSREFNFPLEVLKQDCHNKHQELQKKKPGRDNNDNSWNNGRNENRRRSGPPMLQPAYTYVERRLLHVMMRDNEVAQTVHEKLGDAFNIEDHAALAAYLYAFYAQGFDPDAGRFIASLQDERLERTAAAILMMDGDFPFNDAILEADIQDIIKVPRYREIDRKKEEMMQAERAGDHLLAAQMLSEIITLERQLKGTT
ncbi:DNA primase [Paenibacillus glycanilyticus]|uniref:DNA primase n=1 Tax=Paenibacillus glycanilyticus TaxID=126569 RepID=A0ABQ6GF97_9BACL|nr:DNA primase [Paenibacillus glycanilyticus]GLX69150.1 DNA primase [Paenibacillus glycanilyticus]